MNMETKEDMIGSISRQVMRIINKQGRIEKIPVRLEEGLEITPAEGHTIQAIGEHESINVTELGAYFGVTKSAASQIIGKLAQKGFVKKIRFRAKQQGIAASTHSKGLGGFSSHSKIPGTAFQRHYRTIRVLFSFSGGYGLGFTGCDRRRDGRAVEATLIFLAIQLSYFTILFI